MKEQPFDKTPEFQHFREVMRGVLSVSKQRSDELVKQARKESPRSGERNAPGRKRVKPKRM